MFSLMDTLAQKLREIPELDGWVVRLQTSDVDRKALPSIDILFSGATVEGPRTSAQVAPTFELVLAQKRGPTAGQDLDSAMALVVRALHHHLPGVSGGRNWEPLSLSQVTPTPFADSGVVGVSLAFSTSAFFPGQS